MTLRERMLWRMEKARWWLARLFLAWAGKLLAQSHEHTLYAQTGRAASFSAARSEGNVILQLREPRHHSIIGQYDAHGLLLQLAAAIERRRE